MVMNPMGSNPQKKHIKQTNQKPIDPRKLLYFTKGEIPEN